jgi:hypothetical protein
MDTVNNGKVVAWSQLLKRAQNLDDQLTLIGLTMKLFFHISNEEW